MGKVPKKESALEKMRRSIARSAKKARPPASPPSDAAIRLKRKHTTEDETVNQGTSSTVDFFKAKRTERTRTSSASDALAGLPEWLQHPIRVPTHIDASTCTPIGPETTPYLSARAQKVLRETQGITTLFPIQASVVPLLMKDRGQEDVHDLCVSAPTGSGKTLAYVLPILAHLASRVVPRLRAVVVLPTRDLVTQVRDAFARNAKGTSLRVGTATGATSFRQEQAMLRGGAAGAEAWGGATCIDILVATPGRLMAHLDGTPGFTLQHVAFLVVDEADKLLRGRYHDWLPRLLDATTGGDTVGGPEGHAAAWAAQGAVAARVDAAAGACEGAAAGVAPVVARATAASTRAMRAHLAARLPGVRCDTTTGTPHPDAVAYHRPLVDTPASDGNAVPRHWRTRCQKLLVSATLSRHPGHLAALQLKHPCYLAATDDDGRPTTGQGRDDRHVAYTLPATLTAWHVVCAPEAKPLVVLHLVRTLGATPCLVFTNAVATCARLVRLLQGCGVAGAAAWTRAMTTQARKRARAGLATPGGVLVCADGMARGMDVPEAACVVSYDAPTHMDTFVHRVGRTARAGRSGRAYTLLATHEAAFFKRMMRESGQTSQALRVEEALLAPYRATYEQTLAALQQPTPRTRADTPSVTRADAPSVTRADTPSTRATTTSQPPNPHAAQAQLWATLKHSLGITPK